MDTQRNNINEISMERTVCAGDCPVYTVTFKKNGEALYEGKDNVKKIGPYSGDIDESEFLRLTELVEKLGFRNIEANDSTDTKDAANVILTVNYGDSVKKVSNYAESGPLEAWAVEKVIDALIEDIYWEKV